MLRDGDLMTMEGKFQKYRLSKGAGVGEIFVATHFCLGDTGTCSASAGSGTVSSSIGQIYLLSVPFAFQPQSAKGVPCQEPENQHYLAMGDLGVSCRGAFELDFDFVNLICRGIQAIPNVRSVGKGPTAVEFILPTRWFAGWRLCENQRVDSHIFFFGGGGDGDDLTSIWLRSYAGS